MEISVPLPSHKVEDHKRISTAWNVEMLKELERLLLRLACPNVDPSNCSVFAKTEERLETFLAIANEVEKGADRLAAEYSQKRDSFLPVHRLPEVIIVKILGLALAEEEYDWNSNCRTYLHRQKELRLVCSRWNAIVKAAPMLWSKISCADVSRLKDALRRSADEPLDVVCAYRGCLSPKSHCKRFALEMSEAAGRWGTLDIKGCHWVDFLSSPAPCLTLLRANGRRAPDEEGQYTWSGPFLGGEASKLTEMVLTSFAIPWGACPAFPSLEELEIKSIAKGPTVQQLVDIVSQCPLLKRCTISQTKVVPLSEAGVWSVSGDPVNHPNLKNLHIERIRLDSAVQILNSVHLPADASIELITTNHGSSLGPLLDFVRRRIPEIDTGLDVTSSICIDLEDAPTVGLAFPKHSWKLHFHLTDSKWKDEEQKWQDCGRMVKKICPAFDMDNVGVNLWTLGSQIKRGLKFIRDVFPNIDRLCTSSLSDTLGLLTRPQPAHFADKEGADADEGAPREWLFPNLQDLHLYMNPDTNGLLELIEARSNSPGVKPITKLVIDNSTTPQNVRTKVKGLVPNTQFRIMP